MFELLTKTDATLTSFTGRTEQHGKHRVPAVSFRLQFKGPNTLLDLLSPDVRRTLYRAAEGQEDLPGVEPTTPLLRSKDINTWSSSASYEGWTVTIDHGIDDASAIEMGASKIDSFAAQLFDGGTVEIECRVSTADIGATGAGLLWSKQQSPVSVMFAAPLTPQTNPEAGMHDERQLTLDGNTGDPVGEHSDAYEEAERAFQQSATEAFVDDVEENGPEPTAKTPAQIKREQRFPAKYRDAASGQTWSGRGLKPKWLVEALGAGKSLADFQTPGVH